jgi:predicted RNA-binding Zn ribbon-like protein
MDNFYQFDFESGDLCLDFANTNEWHASQHPVEHLGDYRDLLEWARQASLIDETRFEQLGLLARQQAERAASAYKRAIALREAIYRIFSSHYAAKESPSDDIALLNDALAGAMPHLSLSRTDGGYEWRLVISEPDLGEIAWHVARAAADLLTSPNLGRVRECEDDRGCGYLFIDHSKNRSRRWCSMDSCGNRAKARRHYARQQDTRPEA